MEYVIDGHRYSFNYQARREDYFRYKEMSDAEFVENALAALHFSMLVTFIKGLGSEATVGDRSICHELVHMLDDNCKEDAIRELSEIRNLFNRICYLA